MVGRPPLMSKTLFMAEIFQGAQNEARPFYLGEQKYCLYFQRDKEGIACLASSRSQLQQKKYATALSPWAK